MAQGDDTHSGARLVLGTGFLFGLGYVAYMLAFEPSAVGINLEVYYVAAQASLDGENFLTVAPERVPWFTYVYPPLSIVLFYPVALFPSWQTGIVAHTLVTIAVGIVTARILVHYLASHGRALSRVDQFLVTGFVVASSHAGPSLVYGQVNHHLALAMTIGFVLLERGRQTLGGTAFAMAAFLKVFPAAVGVWLLRQRAWRAIGGAVTTGLGLFTLSVLTFGVDLNHYYLTEALLPRLEHQAFLGGLDPGASYLTLRRPLSVLFPTGPPLLWAGVAFLCLAPPVALLYRDVSTVMDRLLAIQGTLIGMLLFFPSFPIYAVVLYFPLIPLLYLLEPGRPRQLFVTGALLANLSVRLDDVRELLSIVPLSELQSLSGPLTPVFTYVTPPLAGLLLMLVACVLYKRETTSDVIAG